MTEKIQLKKNLDKPLEDVIIEILEVFPDATEIRDYRNKIVWNKESD